jgi:adenylate cyclase
LALYFSDMEDRKLAAIMFTDIVGFSQKMGVDENLALQLLDKHNEILTQSIENFKGTILKHIGDSIFAEFESSTNAVICAIVMQNRLMD